MKTDYDYSFDYILIGDVAVGKTSILGRLLVGIFIEAPGFTIGTQYQQKSIAINGQSILMRIWDTAGQQQFRSMTRSYYQSAAVALVVYDCTRAETFKNVRRWVQEVRTNGPANIVLVLICNKIDLADKRVVSRNQGLKLAKEQDMIYVEISAKSNQNVDEAFLRPAANILQKIDTGIIDPSRCKGIKINPKRRPPVQEPPDRNCKCQC